VTDKTRKVAIQKHNFRHEDWNKLLIYWTIFLQQVAFSATHTFYWKTPRICK